MFKYHSDIDHCLISSLFFEKQIWTWEKALKGGYLDWELGRNSAPRERQKIPCALMFSQGVKDRLL